MDAFCSTRGGLFTAALLFFSRVFPFPSVHYNSLSSQGQNQDSNTFFVESRGRLTDLAIQRERWGKNTAMTEYEHMEMNPISAVRKRALFSSLFFSVSHPNCLSATLNNSFTVRADLAHQLMDKYLKRKAAR